MKPESTLKVTFAPFAYGAGLLRHWQWSACNVGTKVMVG
jgi:hypothetical protein